MSTPLPPIKPHDGCEPGCLKCRGIRVVLAEDETLRHCAHCDRYDDDDPRGHPSCLIVKKDDIR